MSLRIYVDAYSGYKANERPIRFWLDTTIVENELTGVYEIEAVEYRWYEPNAEYFRIRTTDGKRYILRFSERTNEWTLQNAFDGGELLASPGIEIVTVEPLMIRNAETQIAGCERCRGDEAGHFFDAILADVLGKHGAFDFIMSESAHCLTCKAELNERSLFEPDGGIEIEATASI
jgi:hypothetical protein